MFTGIIEELGKVKSIAPFEGGSRISIFASKILNDLNINDSVSVSGICLTTVYVDSDYFTVEAVGETLSKTTLSTFRAGQIVNLERAMTLQTRLGGHIVQGHINFISQVESLQSRGRNWLLKIIIPEDQLKYCIKEGSIAIDGISFTIADISSSLISINLIPHSFENTNMQYLRPGDKVNVEVDIIGKYIERLISKSKNENRSVEQWLTNLGWE